MARTKEEIKAQMMELKDTMPALNVLNSTSKMSVWRLIMDIIVTCIYTLEQIFDAHKLDMQQLIESTNPNYLPWLIQKIKDFQYGKSLVPEDIVYDNTGLTEEDIAAAKIIRHCSITEQRRGLRIKVATESLGVLAPLSYVQEMALQEYIWQLHVGTPVTIINRAADRLRLNLTVYYNPLVLDGSGKRLDGTDDTPIATALDAYLGGLAFNGKFVVAHMIDMLQQVDGVVVPHFMFGTAQYELTDLLLIGVFYLPFSGYLKIEDLTITYIANEFI